MSSPRPGRACALRGDDGFALPLLALTLVVLMIFAAFAVDLGAVYNARRQDQSAADSGALAAAQELSTNNDDLVAEAQDHVYQTLALTAGTLDFDSCDDDADKLAVVATDSSGQRYNCITMSAAGSRVRVKVPPQHVDAGFGAIIGKTNYEHSAFAIAGLIREGFGQVLPFGLFATGSGHVCLRTDNPSSPVTPCAGSSTGDSGVLNFGFFGNDDLGTPSGHCQGNGASARVPSNVAMGIDHDLTLRPVAGAYRIDTIQCSRLPQDPNAADTVTSAGAMQGVADGLFRQDANFSDGQPARLQRDFFADVGYDATEVAEGHTVDSTPLWEFIDPAATHSAVQIPQQCERASFVNALADVDSIPFDVRSRFTGLSVERRMEKMLERCFAHYEFGSWNDNGALSPAEQRVGCGGGSSVCSGILFGRDSVDESPNIFDIQYTPRFGYVPVVWESLGENVLSFKTFQPIFIQRLCLGNQECNQGTFSPGVPYIDNGGNNNDNVSALSAFAFHRNMLPNDLGGDDAPYDINVNRFLVLIR